MACLGRERVIGGRFPVCWKYKEIRWQRWQVKEGGQQGDQTCLGDEKVIGANVAT